MMNLQSLLLHPLTEALSWALLHSLWQGAVAAGLFAVIAIALRRQSDNARYLAACAALAASALIMPRR